VSRSPRQSELRSGARPGGRARTRGSAPQWRRTAGVTLMELLIAVMLLSLLSVGLLFALRIGLNTYSKAQGKLMDNRRVAGAQRILEIGSAIGYSGIWLAGALPKDGMLLTMEKNPDLARTARENFERAGVADRVGVIIGDAHVTIAKVAGPFDLSFQDGAKGLYVPLLDQLVRLLRSDC